MSSRPSGRKGTNKKRRQEGKKVKRGIHARDYSGVARFQQGKCKKSNRPLTAQEQIEAYL